MHFGVGMGRNEAITEIPRQVQLAESLGYDLVTFIDTQSLARDTYVMMTLAAVNSRRLQIGQGVTNPFTRHPAVTANATGTIHELSGGRAVLEIGSGISSTGTLGSRPTPIAHLRKTVETIRGLSRGEDVEWEGETIRSEWMKDGFPIILGSDGPRSMRLAGEIGDGVDIAGAFPAMVKWRMDRINEGAARVGRDLKADGFKLWLRTGVYVGRSKQEAYDNLKSYVATYAYQFWLCHLMRPTKYRDQILAFMPEDLVHEIETSAKAFEMYEHEKIGGRNENLVTDRMIDFFMVCGTPGDCIESISRLQDLGIERIIWSVYPLRDKLGMIERFASEVMPHFR